MVERAGNEQYALLHLLDWVHIIFHQGVKKSLVETVRRSDDNMEHALCVSFIPSEEALPLVLRVLLIS